MAWLSGLFGKRVERKDTVADTLELFRQIYSGGYESQTGDTVTWKSALQVATVLACTRVVCNGTAQVPLKLFRESEDGRSRVPAIDHPLYWVLFRKPNPWQTSYEYRQTLAMHLFLCGNHFSFKNMVGNRIVGLIPLQPAYMQVERKRSGDLRYIYRPQAEDSAIGGEREIPAERIWHIRGMSWNGWFGMEPVALAREAIGLSMAVDRSSAKLFKNGLRTSGTYSVDKTLDEDQYKDLRDWILENTSGDNEGMPLILDRGAKWLEQSMKGVDAQQHETRMAQIQQVASALGVFPHMVGYSDKASTFASAESFFIAHVVHTLAPLYELIEQSIATQLLSDEEMKGGLYAKFIEEGLMRGSMRDTAEMLERYVNAGLMTPNECRAALDLNPDKDPESDKLRVPANIVGKPAPGDPEEPASDDEEDDESVPKQYRVRLLRRD